MPNYKTFTHVLAVVLASLAGFVVTPAGQAVIHQYPYLSGAAGVILTLAAVYHVPTASSVPTVPVAKAS
jgi:hypothetical protein